METQEATVYMPPKTSQYLYFVRKLYVVCSQTTGLCCLGYNTNAQCSRKQTGLRSMTRQWQPCDPTDCRPPSQRYLLIFHVQSFFEGHHHCCFTGCSQHHALESIYDWTLITSMSIWMSKSPHTTANRMSWFYMWVAAQASHTMRGEDACIVGLLHTEWPIILFSDDPPTSNIIRKPDATRLIASYTN